MAKQTKKGKKNRKARRKLSKRARSAPLFMKFNRRNYSKLAREYHHEVHHLIVDLININLRIQKTAVLCRRELAVVRRKESHLRDPNWLNCFEDTLYHLENFAFRASAFRDKIAQFVNQALLLGYDETERELIKKMSKNRIYKEALVHTELKKFEADDDLRVILSKRVYMAHRRYYKPETGWSPILLPFKESLPADPKKTILLWEKNVKQEVEMADKFTKMSMDISNKVMEKINKYWSKHRKFRRRKKQKRKETSKKRT